MPIPSKYLPLIAFLLLSGWLLWPPAEETTNAGASTEHPEQAQYVIKFAAGWAYLPDTHPCNLLEKGL